MEEKQNNSVPVRPILLVLLAAIVVLFIVLAARNGGLKGLLNRISGRELASDFYYENCAGGSFAVVGDCFAACSNAGLYVFHENGEQAMTRLFPFRTARMCAAGKYAAIYDLGGNSAVFFSGPAVLAEVDTANPIVSVSVNDGGYYCVCAREQGYLGAVTVYNRNGTDLYKWYSGSARILSADVLGSDQLLVLTVGEGGCRLTLFSLTATEPKARFDYAGLAVDAFQVGDTLALVTTESVILLDRELNEKAVYRFAGTYLRACAAGSDFIALVLSDYQVGGSHILVTVDLKGQELGRSTGDGDVLSLDASGGAAAVLTQDALAVYERDLRLRFRREGISGVERAVLTPEELVIAAGAFSAHVYAADGVEQ